MTWASIRRPSAVKSVVGHARDNITWHWWDNRPFFHGEVEPCINGRVLAIAAYFGQDYGDVDRLLGEQMADGGWNCEAGERLGPRLVPHDDQRARGTARG